MFGHEYRFKGDRFHLSDISEKIMAMEVLKCQRCSKGIPIREVHLRCLFCMGRFHVLCYQTLCICAVAPLSSLNPPMLSLKGFMPPKDYKEVKLPK